MGRHLTVMGAFLALTLGAAALWLALAGLGAERAEPGQRLLVWLPAPEAGPAMVAASGHRPIDALAGGRLWIVAAEGPGSARILRGAGAALVLAQPMAGVVGLGGCGPIPLPRRSGA